MRAQALALTLEIAVTEPDERPRRAPSAGIRHERFIDGEAEVSLPTRIMLFTLDQVATMLALTETQLAAKYICFEGRTTGPNSRRLMKARNIAPTPEDKPDWRITEREVIRYCRVRGIRFHTRGWATY